MATVSSNGVPDSTVASFRAAKKTGPGPDRIITETGFEMGVACASLLKVR